MRAVGLSLPVVKYDCRRTDAFLVAVGKNAAAPIPVASGLVGPADESGVRGHLDSSTRIRHLRTLPELRLSSSTQFRSQILDLPTTQMNAY